MGGTTALDGCAPRSAVARATATVSSMDHRRLRTRHARWRLSRRGTGRWCRWSGSIRAVLVVRGHDDRDGRWPRRDATHGRWPSVTKAAGPTSPASPPLSSLRDVSMRERVTAVAPFASAVVGAILLVLAAVIFVNSRGFGYDYAAYDAAAMLWHRVRGRAVPARHRRGVRTRRVRGAVPVPASWLIALVPLTGFTSTPPTLLWMATVIALLVVGCAVLPVGTECVCSPSRWPASRSRSCSTSISAMSARGLRPVRPGVEARWTARQRHCARRSRRHPLPVRYLLRPLARPASVRHPARDGLRWCRAYRAESADRRRRHVSGLRDDSPKLARHQYGRAQPQHPGDRRRASEWASRR